MSAVLAGLITLLIFGFLMLESLPALTEVGLVRFLTDPSWHPTSRRFDLTAMVAGSVAVTAGAVLLATPLGLLSAVYCRFFAPPGVARIHRGLIGLLAGIPSVVFGLWGLTVLVPLIGSIEPPGPSLLAATLILAIMILPTVALLSDAALGDVPAEQLRVAAALGFSRSATVWKISFPIARSGVFTAALLATGRAIGETMAVLMVSGNVVQLPSSLFAPFRALTANIALEMAYAMNVHRSALFVSGLVLTAVIALLVALADRLDPEGLDA